MYSQIILCKISIDVRDIDEIWHDKKNSIWMACDYIYKCICYDVCISDYVLGATVTQTDYSLKQLQEQLWHSEAPC